jgi:hypothetical protein
MLDLSIGTEIKGVIYARRVYARSDSETAKRVESIFQLGVGFRVLGVPSTVNF